MNVLTVLCSGGWMPGHLSEGWRRLGCTVHEFFYGRTMGRSWSAAGRAGNRDTFALSRELRWSATGKRTRCSNETP